MNEQEQTERTEMEGKKMEDKKLEIGTEALQRRRFCSPSSLFLPVQKRKLFTFLSFVFLLLPGATQSAEKQLLQDTQFAEGFGAAFIYGKAYSGGRRPPTGEVTAYRNIHPWQVHLIPDGPIGKIGVKTHPWDFQEGYHNRYRNKRGQFVQELHAHRLVVNHLIETNTPNKLQFVQYNNDGLPKGDPRRNTKLVKRVTTDRQGNLRLFYNSQNEIRNAAIGHSARWARDTWPHFLVNQRFLEPIPLKDFDRLDFSVTYQVDQMKRLSNWPNMIKGAARSGMNLKFMFFLRNQSNLDQKLFAGMMLYTSRANAWKPHLGIEQHGNVFYRESVAPDGENTPKLGETRSVTREIKAMLTEAIRQAREKQPKLSADLDDYAIYNFSIGFEGMGHWESEALISNLSLTGTTTSVEEIRNSAKLRWQQIAPTTDWNIWWNRYLTGVKGQAPAFDTGYYLAFGDSYLLHSKWNALVAQDDLDALEFLIARGEAMFETRPDRNTNVRLKDEWRNRPKPKAFLDSNYRYKDKARWTANILSNANALYCIARALVYLKEHPDLLDRTGSPGKGTYEKRMTALIPLIAETMDYFEPEYVVDDSGRGWYEDSYFAFYTGNPAYREWPYNYQSGAGRVFLCLWQLTGDPKYRTRVSQLAKNMKSGLRRVGGAYFWSYAKYRPRDQGEDLSHASINADFMIHSAEQGIVFDHQDIQRIAATFRKLYLPGKGFCERLGSTQLSLGRSKHVGAWLRILRHDTEFAQEAFPWFESEWKQIHSPWDQLSISAYLGVPSAKIP